MWKQDKPIKLPVSKIEKMVMQLLPQGGNIDKEAIELLSCAGPEFITFLASEFVIQPAFLKKYK